MGIALVNLVDYLADFDGLSNKHSAGVSLHTVAVIAVRSRWLEPAPAALFRTPY